MIFSLDVRRANKGDCLIVHYGTKKDPGLIVIDGGPAQVYKPHLKPRLDVIRTARKLAPTESLPIDLLMVSHIDDDHIRGILELTGELVDAKNAKKQLPLKVRSFWHNSFDNIIGNTPEQLQASLTAAFGTASLGEDVDVEGLDPEAARVLASVEQGFRLRADARRLAFRVNPEFDEQLIMAAEDNGKVDFGKGLSLTVAGPMKAELTALQKKHDDFLKARKKAGKKGPASLAAFTDNSIPNLSSIVVLAKAGGKTMLLTGDARGDRILEGLELVGSLKPGKTLKVDLLKMPHHGSSRNMTQGFLERIVASHYVFSGNGEHGNPERETLDMLRLARGAAKYTIHLTYPVDEIDEGRKADWKKEQDKERGRKKNNPSLKLRPNWSPAKHSLASFFDAHADMAKRVRIADESAHVIDLLEPVDL